MDCWIIGVGVTLESILCWIYAERMVIKPMASALSTIRILGMPEVGAFCLSRLGQDDNRQGLQPLLNGLYIVGRAVGTP